MRKLILIISALLLFAVAAHAQKLTTTQPTTICDTTTITNCTPVSATLGVGVNVLNSAAAANANQVAANADTVSCATDRGCAPGAAISTTTTMQSSATANGNGTVLAVDGQSSAIVTAICTVSCSGGTQLIFEANNDIATVGFIAVNATQLGSANAPATTFTLSGGNAIGWQVPVSGLKQLRARILNYSAGTVNVIGTTVPVDFNSRVLAANQYYAGTAADTNSGNKSAATARMVLATDQPLMTIAQGVRPWADGAMKSGAVTTAMTGTTSTSVIAGLASNYVYITSCTTSNASLTVSTDINLQDGSGGTVLYVLPTPAATVATTGGGGGTFTFPTPLKVPTVGNGLFAANVTTGSSTKISCNGFYSTVTY